jgi:hypothetical protein
MDVAKANSVPSARVREILTRLATEREGLRRDSADRAALEANRLSIVYWQSRLSRSLQNERPDVE